MWYQRRQIFKQYNLQIYIFVTWLITYPIQTSNRIFHNTIEDGPFSFWCALYSSFFWTLKNIQKSKNRLVSKYHLIPVKEIIVTDKHRENIRI